MTVKAMRAARTETVAALATAFNESGVEYTCAAAVMHYVAPYVTRHMVDACGWSPSRIQRRVADAIHEQWLKDK